MSRCNPQPVDCLIILGMHRSGTSALTGCLHLLGVNLGHAMMPPTPSNQAGYWENNDFVIVHDLLLKELGYNSNMIGSLPDWWLESDAAARAKQRISNLIAEHFQAQGLWAIKDPRMCRLMPLWLPLLDTLGYKPGFILTLRNPLEVAGSLAKRSNFSLRKGLLLWLMHNRDAFAACQDRPFTVHTYDQLLADPVRVFHLIEQKLGITFPKPLAGVYPELLDFIQPGLRTQHAGQLRTAPVEHKPIQDKEQPGSAISNEEINLYSRLYTRVLNENVFFQRQAGTNTDLDAAQQLNFPFLYPAAKRDNAETDRTPLPPEQSGERDDAKLFDQLLAQLGEQETACQKYELQMQQSQMSAPGMLYAQIFFPQAGGASYDEKFSLKFSMCKDRWQEIVCTIPQPAVLSIKALRFDPINACGTVQISSLRLTNLATDKILFQAESPADFQTFHPASHALVLSEQKCFTLISTGYDPQIFLPKIPNTPDCPLELRLWIKYAAHQDGLQKILGKLLT